MIGPVECAECGWSDNGHLRVTNEGIREYWLFGDEGRWVLECGHCGEWLDKDNVNRRGSGMRREWAIWEFVVREWRHIAWVGSERVAIEYARERRAVFFRPICVTPSDTFPDVAYPEAAR